MPSEPREHHTVPQFYLRAFASDEARTKIETVAKEGELAIWNTRSIRGIGWERDFYVHLERGRPVSVETDINRRIETPISRSDTWAKILSGSTGSLDRFDRPILYALVRHLEARSSHYLHTGLELERMAADPASSMPFSEEERRMYTFRRDNPDYSKFMHNQMSVSRFMGREYDGSLILVGRSPIKLRTSTTPVMVSKCPPHDKMLLPLPGMVPFQRMLALNAHTLVSVVDGDFGGQFLNTKIDEETARGFNRSMVAHFAHFPHVRHIISSREHLVDDMTWAPYEVTNDTPRKIAFRRNNKV